VAALPGTLRLLALLLAGGVQLFATVEPLRLSHTWDRFASGSQRFLWPVCVWLLLAAAHACIARRRRWLPLVAALCFAAGYVGWAFDEARCKDTERLFGYRSGTLWLAAFGCAPGYALLARAIDGHSVGAPPRLGLRLRLDAPTISTVLERGFTRAVSVPGEIVDHNE